MGHRMIEVAIKEEREGDGGEAEIKEKGEKEERGEEGMGGGRTGGEKKPPGLSFRD